MLEEKLSLEGKTIVITGGGTGLGREMTLAMACAGADLVIASRRIGPIDEVAQAARDMGRRAITVSTDVTDTSQVAALMERAPTPAVHRMANMLVEQAGHSKVYNVTEGIVKWIKDGNSVIR